MCACVHMCGCVHTQGVFLSSRNIPGLDYLQEGFGVGRARGLVQEGAYPDLVDLPL